MIRKKVIVPHRIRTVPASFAFIPHRFLSDGFWKSLSIGELVLYLFLVLVSDRSGLSYYSSKKICASLGFSHEDYIDARDRLIARDLVAFDDVIFQVLELPSSPTLDLPEKCC